MSDMDNGRFGELLQSRIVEAYDKAYDSAPGEYEKLFNVDGPPPAPPTWRQRLRWWLRDRRESLALRIAPWLRYED